MQQSKTGNQSQTYSLILSFYLRRYDWPQKYRTKHQSLSNPKSNTSQQQWYKINVIEQNKNSLSL